jgi:hypothetical protein
VKHSHHWTKFLSSALFDKLFSAIIWGATGGQKDTSGNGLLNGRTVSFDAAFDQLQAFGEGDSVDIVPQGGKPIINFIEAVNLATRQVTLRFGVEDVADGSRVDVVVSPLNNIDRKYSKFFGLNVEKLWSEHIPVAWGRMLSGFLNRENWFPGPGFYLIALLLAGLKNQGRVSFEQDAAFQSGDLYSRFTVSQPNEVFVGQFSRVHAFIHARSGAASAFGLSALGDGISNVLTVEYEPPQAPSLKPLESVIAGSILIAPDRVKFRENWLIPMKSKATNGCLLRGKFTRKLSHPYRRGARQSSAHAVLYSRLL